MKKTFLNATHLRILALFLMLLDHMWATVVPGNLWMTCVGRLAFPIFAFQAAEGYHHTHDFRGYCKRLAIFAAVSLGLVLRYVPLFSFLSEGFVIIISAVAGACVAAWLKPVKAGEGDL